MLRHGILLVGLAVAGLCAIVVYSASMERVLRPLSTPLRVTTGEMTTSKFTLEPGYKYEVTISVDPGHRVPYLDCLLGESRGLYGDCKGHPSVLDLAWRLRNHRGGVVASGTSPREGAMFGYTGDRVDTTIAYFSVLRTTNVSLQFRYRRNAAALAPLHPYVEVLAPDSMESSGVGEVFIALLLVALGGIGVVILLSFIWSHYLRTHRGI